jgi:hypothetical protein
MKYYFHPSAKRELNEAIDFYEECQAGLGTEFTKEVYSTIYRITQYPKAWPCLSENTRRCLTKRFPYGIIYQILDHEILIIAVMQLNRKPAYWKERTT